MTAPQIVETARLRLRPFQLADFDAYAAMLIEPEFVRHIGGKPFSREAAWTRFLRQRGLWATLGFGFFGLELKGAGRFIGYGGFHELRRSLTPSIEGTLEAGWGLTRALHGRGYAEEAMRAAVNWAEAHFRDMRMTCVIDPENAPSLRLAAKLGFVEMARTTYNDNPIVLLERARPAS